MRLLCLADSHLGTSKEYIFRGFNPYERLQAVLKHALSAHPDIDGVLHLGDLSGDKLLHAELAGYDLISTLLDPLPGPRFLVGGNHDESELAFRLNRWPLQRAPSLAPPAAGLHYRLEWQGLTIIGMNTSVRAQRGTTISDAARGWLKGELEAASEPILFLIHHPIVAYGCGWMDRTMGITNGVALHQLLATHGEKILGVFHGHVHHGRASMVNGVRYFSVPSTIFQFATGALAPDSQIQAAPPGYMIVETDRASLSVEFCALAE